MWAVLADVRFLKDGLRLLCHVDVSRFTQRRLRRTRCRSWSHVGSGALTSDPRFALAVIFTSNFNLNTTPSLDLSRTVKQMLRSATVPSQWHATSSSTPSLDLSRTVKQMLRSATVPSQWHATSSSLDQGCVSFTSRMVGGVSRTRCGGRDLRCPRTGMGRSRQ